MRNVFGASRWLVAIEFVLAFGAVGPLANAQSRLWFADSTRQGDVFGYVRLGPDVDGDGVSEVSLSSAFGTCTNPGEGWVAIQSFAAGELSRWCGPGGGTAFGLAAAWLGDVDGLGIPDLAIGEPFFYDPINWGADTGRLRVYSSESQLLLYEIVGAQSVGRFGAPCETLDDIDQDGVADFVVGARSYGSNNNGALLVHSGRTGAQIRQHSGGFQQSLGQQIASLGDADGDGIGDYAGSLWNNCGGRVQVFSGRTGAKLAQFDGLSGVCDNFGYSLSSGGDLDGDGLEDLLVSAASPFSGKKGDPDGRVEAWSIAKQSLIWSIPGTGGEWFGEYLCGVGDINGDGFREILVAAGWDDHDGKDIGRVDLISGRSHRSLFRFYGGIPGLLSYGEMLTRGTDFDGDGIEDLIIGTPYGGTNQSQGGHTAIYAGNDIFLQADPLAPGSAETVTVDLRGAEPFSFGLVGLIAIDGTPLFETLLITAFDVNGEMQLQADTDPSVSGHDFTILGYAVNRAGRGPLMVSSPQTVSVQ